MTNRGLGGSGRDVLAAEDPARVRRAQCPQSMNYMKLGAGEFCAAAQAPGAMAKLIDWLPGSCEQFEAIAAATVGSA